MFGIVYVDDNVFSIFIVFYFGKFFKNDKIWIRIRNYIFYGIKNISKCNFLFLGLIYVIMVFGVVVGYMGGGFFFNLWVDVDKLEVDVDK